MKTLTRDTVRNAIPCAGLLLSLAACDGTDRTYPTAPPSPAGVAVSGWVWDSAFRPIAGTRIEIVNGTDAGLSTISSSSGQFLLRGNFDAATQFLATKDGYVGRSHVLGKLCATCAFYFFLDLTTPPVNIAGDYTLTFAADSACPDLPDVVRTRSYPATISPATRQNGSGSPSFRMTFPGVRLLEGYDYFDIFVAGDYVVFSVDRHEGSALIEQLEPDSYFGIVGSASTSVGTALSNISIPLEGAFEYCKKRTSPSVGCAPDAKLRCESHSHRLVLKRR